MKRRIVGISSLFNDIDYQKKKKIRRGKFVNVIEMCSSEIEPTSPKISSMNRNEVR